MSPILVPSKGRPGCPTAKLLKGLEFTVLVEPQDAALYSNFSQGSTLFTLTDDNQGLAYVRNTALEIARGSNWPAFWMLDDDIKGFYAVAEGKTVSCEAKRALDEAEAFFRDRGVALGGLEYQQFAWSNEKGWAGNSFCDVCVWIDVQKTLGLTYDKTVELKEDRDFALQVLRSEQQTIRYARYAFSAPSNGSNAGGLQSEYKKQNLELERCLAMEKKWGTEICRHIVKDSGRHDLEYDWKKVAPRMRNLEMF